MSEYQSKSLWSDYSARHSLYAGIAYASRSREGTRVRSPGSRLMDHGQAILKADRAFFEARRAEILAEREAIALSFEQAGQPELAALVRSRPAPTEWSKP